MGELHGLAAGASRGLACRVVARRRARRTHRTGTAKGSIVPDTVFLSAVISACTSPSEPSELLRQFERMECGAAANENFAGTHFSSILYRRQSNMES